MAKNSALYVKRATIAALKAAAGVTDLVPAERVYPMQRPSKLTWPWIGYGVPINNPPFRASCLDGSDLTVAIHGFAQTTGSGPATVSGEDAAHAINAAVEGVLDEAALDLAPHGCPFPAIAHFTSVGGQVIQDGQEGDKFHGFVNFRIVVSS